MKRTVAMGGLFVVGMLVGSASNEFLRAQGSQYLTKQIAQTEFE